MKKRTNCIMFFLVFLVLLLNFSCLDGPDDSVKPELSIKIENGKTILNIGGEEIGKSWFFIFENEKNIKIDKYYNGYYPFEEEVARNVKIIYAPDRSIHYESGVSIFEIVKSEIEANGKDRIYLKRNTKYGIYFFFPNIAYGYPVFYFIYDGNTVKLVK